MPLSTEHFPFGPDDNIRRGVVNRLSLFLMVAIAAVGIGVGYLTETPESPRRSESGGQPDLRNSGQLAAADRPQPVLQRFSLSPADAADSMESPSLVVDSKGRIFVAWATEVDAHTRRVLLTTSEDGGQSFAEPVTVVTTGVHTAVSQMRGRTIERRLKTLPHLACVEDRILLSYVAAGEARDSVRLQLAEASTDSLKFSEPVTVHRSLEARPSFTSLHAAPDGTVVCSWLDNRHHVQQPYAAIRRPGQLEFEPEQMVYSGPENKGICPCCPTEAFVFEGGVGVAFRGNESGFRDMWIAQRSEGAEAFSAPVAVVEPTWQFGGCPHDGPSVCQTSHGLHIAWMDAHAGPERVFVQNIGATREPVCLAGPGAETVSQAHPMLRAFGDLLFLVWDQSMASHSGKETPSSAGAQQPSTAASPDPSAAHENHSANAGVAGGRCVWIAVSHDGGQTFQDAHPVAQAAGVFQTRPQIHLMADGQMVLAWMELSSSGKQVVVATFPNFATSMTPLVAHSGDRHD